MRNNPWETELKLARSHRNRLRTVFVRLTGMSCEWDGLSSWLETESERLIGENEEHIIALEEQTEAWAGLRDDSEEIS